MAAITNPFPGMDPFLELDWNDTHVSLISEARKQLNERLRGTGLRARSERRLLVDEGDGDGREIQPDVVALEQPPFETGGTAVLAAPADVAVLTPPILVVEDDPEIQSYLEIRSVQGDKVITVIEFVSPTNKRPGRGRDLYLAKRDECKAGGVNFVEIDLTRKGRRTLPPPVANRPEADATYVAAVHRHHPRRIWQLYPMPLRQPLANLAIPLRPEDADVPLLLGPIVNEVRDSALMSPQEYQQPLDPPLSDDDAAWVARQLAGVV
jgi:hypothetical protein